MPIDLTAGVPDGVLFVSEVVSAPAPLATRVLQVTAFPKNAFVVDFSAVAQEHPNVPELHYIRYASACLRAYENMLEQHSPEARVLFDEWQAEPTFPLMTVYDGFREVFETHGYTHNGYPQQVYVKIEWQLHQLSPLQSVLNFNVGVGV